ncbi:iron ABC transporter permease [Dyella sp.]|uniref:FecCD family ABC transporter permease n=1 Tax=Dyella sp. TaxID=1869338 RepID=UPI002ED0AF42
MNSVALPRIRTEHTRALVLPGLSVLLVGMALLALGSGAIGIPASQVLAALWRKAAGEPAQAGDAIVWALRLPRVLMACLVGAALASSGAAMQGLFRNPLVEPGLIGVSSGAALGAIGMMVLGGPIMASLPAVASSFGVAMAAFVGGLAATCLVYLLGRRRPGMATLLLAGVAISAVAIAGVGMLTFVANEHQLRDLSFWTLGSLGGTDGWRLAAVAGPMLLPIVLMLRDARALNALLLGEQDAALLGFQPGRVRARLIVLVAMATSAAVAMCGVIGFVGLLVPHVLRMIWGPDHRLLLPGSALAGATLLVAADTVARVVVAPAELPIGVLTALLGGPFFLWLLMRTRIGEAQA